MGVRYRVRLRRNGPYLVRVRVRVSVRVRVRIRVRVRVRPYRCGTRACGAA